MSTQPGHDHRAATSHGSTTGSAEHVAEAGETKTKTQYTAGGELPGVGGIFHGGEGPSASDQAYGDNSPATEAATNESAPPIVEPNGNQAAMLVKGADAKIMNKKVHLPKGTYVEVLREDGEYARCRVFSGHGGHTALLHLDNLDRQPALSEKDGHKKDLDKAGYLEYRGKLWHGDPRATDVDQGRLNDCYILAPLAALAATDPGAIKRLFSSHDPNQGHYEITLHKKSGDGYKPVKRTIRTVLPSKGNLEEGTGSPIYGGKKGKFSEVDTEHHDIALWPLLLEKAFATMDLDDEGGYEALDDGGIAMHAMEMLTGRKAAAYGLESPDAALSTLHSLRDQGKAVVCNTKDDADKKTLKKLNLHKWHFYQFIGFHGSKLQFRNPWGHDHPELVPVEDFVKVFGSIQAMGTNQRATAGKADDGGGIIHGGDDEGPQQLARDDLGGGGIIHGGKSIE